MNKIDPSRRTILEMALAIAATASVARTAVARPSTGLSASNEETIRKYYAEWEKKDWNRMDGLLQADFTFTSPAGDDHINKSVFKEKCWESQVGFIDRFDLVHVSGSGNEALVLYVCHTKNGKTFRNVEYLKLRDARLESLECFFGQQSSFPSAVSKG